MFSNVTHDFVGDDFQHIEVDGLGEGSALPDHHNISFLYGESGGAVHWDVSMSLLISVVFGDIVEIVASDNNGPLHLG